jgi:hypothetical protein
MKNVKHLALNAAALGLPIALAACGGNSGDGGTPPPVTPTSLSLSGTAATGAAIAGGTVTAKCAAGAATTATTGADGRYTLAVSSGALPCALQVTSSDAATTLYSVAAGSGSSATANITPLTQLVVASLTGADPATLFSGFDSSHASAVTTSAITQAEASVVATLSAAGIDISALGDLVTGALTAATSTTTGNAYDAALDTLQATLAASTDGDGNAMTLATLTSAVASASPAAPAPTASAKASLPADLLLKPAASTCAALRSTSYRIVMPQAGAALADQVDVATLDAATLAIAYADGSTGQLTPHATEACRFTDETGKSDIVVSPAGVIALRSYDADSATYRAGIAFPEQAHTLADLAGTWNTLGLQWDGTSAYVGATATGTFSATGTLSAISSCGDAGDWNVTVCETAGTTPSFQVDAAGGFDAFAPGSSTPGSRTFAYRSGSGDLMMVNVDDDGSFEIRTPAKAVDAPAVGRVSTTWDLRATNTWLATPAVSSSTNTVQGVDASGASYTRLASTVGGSDEHVETVQLNDPRSGYNFRAAATVTGTDGTTVVNVAEWTNLPVRGMGLNALLRPAQKQFMFSVQQP